jgi:glycosyltransferase involved in cell wall biosynthesis
VSEWNSGQIKSIRKGKGVVRGLSGNTQLPKTEWFLFLESDEYLTAEDYDELLRYAANCTSPGANLCIERHLEQDVLKDYAWVTTRRVFEDPPRSIGRFFTVELRLLRYDRLKNVELNAVSDGEETTRFVVNLLSSDSDVEDTAVCVSRHSKIRSSESSESPSDVYIYKKGHQFYFDDSVFSARFQWPHTVYHAIRYDYVPAVIDAAKEGLTTPEVVCYTMVYLLRFRHFAKAAELMAEIPESWLGRNPDLINVTATLHYIEGHHKRALWLFWHGMELFPDIRCERIARNGIKIALLLERYEEIDHITRRYEELTGKELVDDYLFEFKKNHDGIPKRSATLTVCMIIKDEEDNLERSIRSVEHMADEVVVVDTGSTDDSFNVAKSLGATVYRWEWCDDFSAARNYAISKANCDYIFMLDADEYITPFLFLECQTLKRLLPVDRPHAVRLHIGSYFNDTDWFFLAAEPGNFRTEIVSTRMFPRLPEIQYKGRIKESVDESLKEKGISHSVLPENALHILHLREKRYNRIRRKYRIYEKVCHPNGSTCLAAIKDFSFLNDVDETLRWLREYWRVSSDEDPAKLKMGLRLAGLLEDKNLDEALGVYRELVRLFPNSALLMLRYGNAIVGSGQLQLMKELSVDSSDVEWDIDEKDELDYQCLRSLQCFEMGGRDYALSLLVEVLEKSPSNIFGQALRLYYLVTMQKLHGFGISNEYLSADTYRCNELNIHTPGDLLYMIETLSRQLQTGSYLKERALIVKAMENLDISLEENERVCI